jgi:hypothetical protein
LSKHRRSWLRVALNIHQRARSSVLIATQLSEHYEPLLERAWFSEIHYLALVCDSDQITERLQRRPGWRRVTDDRIEQTQEFNEWLKVNGPTTSPSMTLLDTSDTDPQNRVEWPNG